MLNLWREMRRRHVLRIAGIYVAAGWVFIEVLANVLPMFEAPIWVGKTFTLVLVLFFPIALIIAWAFEITPDGIKLDDRPMGEGEALPPALPDYLIASALVVVIGLNFVDFGDDSPQQVPSGDSLASSLAVLPFIDFSESGNSQYLGNGIAESVLNGLALTEGLRVASRTSSFAVQNQNLDAREIGERLDVDQILEGSVRRSANRLRVSAQLTSVDSGYQIWSNTYDREFDDIFTIEEDIARAIVRELRGPLALGDDQIVKSGTANPKAYDLNLQGRYLFNTPTQENFRRATALFQQAIEVDPDYWAAHGYLAFCLGYASIYTSYAEQATPTAVSTELALRKNPDNVPALLIKGFMQRSPDKAYPYYQRAINSDQDRDLTLYVYHNDYLRPQNRGQEIREQILTALREDPTSLLLLQPLAMLESHSGNFDRALELVARLGEADGSEFLVSSVLMDVHYRRKEVAELKRVTEDSLDKIGRQNGFSSMYLVQALVMSGEIEQARLMLDEMFAIRDRGEMFSATTIGLSLAALGDMDEAASWLVQANRERDFWLRWHLLSALEDFPALAEHPEIIQLRIDMGLDQASIDQRILAGR